MDRRSFFRTCSVGAGLLAGAVPALPSGTSARRYARVRLLDDHGEPLRIGALHPGAAYVFPYPYATTPCFLIDLGRAVAGRTGLATEAGERYDWPGGVGPVRSVVAYSAICAHKMAHPTRTISYITYRGPREPDEPETGVISCCAENSRYDPFAGALVLDGPAPQPLATILLEHDAERDELHAVGTLGGEMFQRYFAEFETRLRIEHPNAEPDQALTDDVVVRRIEDFSANVVSC